MPPIGKRTKDKTVLTQSFLFEHEVGAELEDGSRVRFVAGIDHSRTADYLAELIAQEVDKAKAARSPETLEARAAL